MKRLAALAAFKLSLYLKQQKNEELFRRYSQFLVPEMTEEKFLAYHELPEFLFEDAPALSFRYRRIFDLLEENGIAVAAFQLYMLVCMDNRALSLLEETFGMRLPGPCIGEAGAVAYRDGNSLEDTGEMYEAFLLVRELLLADTSGGDFLRAPFLPDAYLAAWLRGDAQMDYALEGRGEIWRAGEKLPETIIMKREKAEAAEFLKRQQGYAAVYVSGETGSGRKEFVREASGKAGISVLSIPYQSLERQGMLQMGLWRRVLRECRLQGIALCITDLTPCGELKACPEEFLRAVEEEYERLELPLFLTGSLKVKAAPALDTAVYTAVIEEYTPKESAAFWEYFSEAYLPETDGFPAGALASKMNLTAGQIQRALDQYVSLGHTKVTDIREIFRVCYQILDDGRYRDMKIIRGGYTWEDLKLPAYPAKLLREVCDQAEYQLTVLNQWGMREKISYGRSVSALLSGPPGTGKTMAAQVIANHLGLDIYRVDLSQVTDKYIGETEKRLKAVFDQAEKSNMILLFDEADALFGKRSEVTDAKDKYANTEVSYLLQRMEEYTGVVLMTTNLVSNIDGAFLRRFRYHIRFHMPGKKLREKLWEDMLDTVPKEGIDFPYLAAQFKISGAQIKNIALNACYKAASAGGLLQMKHLAEAIFQEKQKEGGLMVAGDFGVYGKLLEELMQLMNEETD